MIIGIVILSLCGIVCTVLGYLLWKRKMIAMLHYYHRDKVKEKDKDRFCTISGCGLTVMGIGLLLNGMLIAITDSALSFIAFGIGFFVGISMLFYATLKYNR